MTRRKIRHIREIFLAFSTVLTKVTTMDFKVLFFFVALATICSLASAEEPDLSKNIIDGPIDCPEGQKPDANGKCQEIWGRTVYAGNRNIIDIPPSCRPCYQADQNGVCRLIFGCEV